MDYNYLPLDASDLNFKQVKNYLRHRQLISITFKGHMAVVNCREYLDKKIAVSDELFYGINTGFGFLQNVAINKLQLQELQNNLLKSHACGMGEEVPAHIVRLMMMLKVKSLSYGHSGVSIDLVKRLIDMHNEGLLPVIYTKGSLGASGDLAPLSHLSLPLIGLGEVRKEEEILDAAAMLNKYQWNALELKSKEGLALINGTQFMSAYGLFGLAWAERLLQWANCIASISFDAFACNRDCLDEHLHAIRPHKGQGEAARLMRQYIEGSSISAAESNQVQDPYSFRCTPQVHGATMDTFDFVLNTFMTEINSVTDNPNIFSEEDMILSGGNFHGQPLALGLDFLAIALSEIANISERRTYQLLSGLRGLPLFLVNDPGLNSGLMIPQYTAASLVSENKQLCTPASVDSISSSNNQEDHVSMGANAATKCLRVIRNVEQVLAIELLTAMQALEFRHPLKSSPGIEQLFEAFREQVTFNQSDRVLRDDLMASLKFLDEKLERIKV